MASLINQNWVFGQRAMLSFSTTSPTASGGTAITTSEGCASISNANGGLLMYTDGTTVWDATHTPKVGPLQGHSSATQSAIIVPDPANPIGYFVFTVGFTGNNVPVACTWINAQTWANNPVALLAPPSGWRSTEKLTAIQHANCRDFWVLTFLRRPHPTNPSLASGPGLFRVWLVSPNGVQHVADTPMTQFVNDVGYLRGSPDGARLAFANWTDNNAMVCPFDTTTGVADFSTLATIAAPTLPIAHARQVYGVEFSPTGRFLYFSVLGASNANVPAGQGFVYQQDLGNLGAPPVAAGPPKPNLGGSYALGALQLGPDNRIYLAQDGEPSLGVIASPDNAGTACGLAYGAVMLASNTLSRMGLPNLIPNACDCPCEVGHCDAAVDRANWLLNAKANRKTFTEPAIGQTWPTGCGLAFEAKSFPPFFTLHWGDGPADKFESDDTEEIFVRVHNPYRNLVYRGLKIFNIRVTPNQLLPDGTDALRLIPAEIVCFDEIGPCSQVARDFAFLIVHALVQGYQITFDYCIDEIAVVGGGDGKVAFPVTVFAS